MEKINRFRIYIILLFVLVNVIHAEKLAVFKENFATPFMAFSKEYIYIGDKGTFSINIYDRKNFSFVKKFGGKGEGPGQFMWIHSIYADQDILYVSSSTKISIFSKEGTLKKEIRLDPNSGNYLPFGRKFISQTYLDGKTPGENYQIINLIGENGKKIKEFYSTPITTIWTFKEPKNDCRLIVDCVAYNVYDRKLYIGNTMKGFYFIIFNENGEKISEINLPYEKKIIKTDEKDEYISRLVYWQGQNVKKKYNFVFPEYYPAFKSFQIVDDRIYIFLHNTHPMTNSEQQIIILDLQGKILKKVVSSLPLDGAFYISDRKFYYLTDNEKTEMWELHSIKIDN